MPLATRFADFLHDLQQLEKTALPNCGPLILDAFTRHSPFDSGARLPLELAGRADDLPDHVQPEHERGAEADEREPPQVVHTR